MSLLLDIFVTFFKIGLVSFGGGYAMIPVIQGEVEAHRWLSLKQFTDIIAVSAMAPGPIAANSATVVGYKLAGFSGAVTACIAVILPSFLLILLIGKCFSKFSEHPMVKAAFYGLRPTLVGIITYAAYKLMLSEGILGGSNFIEVKSLMLMIIAYVVLIKTKVNPLYLILSSGLLGIILFR